MNGNPSAHEAAPRAATRSRMQHRLKPHVPDQFALSEWDTYTKATHGLRRAGVAILDPAVFEAHPSVEMADPITLAALMICSGVKIASSLAQFMEDRKRSKIQTAALESRLERESPVMDAAAEQERQKELRRKITDGSTNDVLFIMIIIGQRLLTLEVVNLQHVPGFATLVEQNLVDEEWTQVYDRLDQTLKYTAAIGIFFCAECAPMHIYRGFGAAVMNNWRWACPIQNGNTVQNQTDRLTQCVANEMDNMLAKLKSIPRAPLLTKVPKEIATVIPDYNTLDVRNAASDKKNSRSARKDFKKVAKTMEMLVAEVNRNGHPPLKSGHKFEAIRLLWATWDSPFSCKDVWGNMFEIADQQSDPGRLFYAFTIGGFLDLRPGEIVAPYDQHICGLIRWLEGCPGMTFRVIGENEVDWDSLKISKPTQKAFKKLGLDFDKEIRSTLNGVSIMFDPVLAVRQETRAARTQTSPEPQFSPTSSRHSYFGSSPPSYQASTTTTVTSPGGSMKSRSSESPKIRRRPVPTPPRPSLRKVRAAFDFEAEEEGELSMNLGDLLDVVKEIDDSGWVEVRRLDGKIGVVPGSFIASCLSD